MSTHSEEFIAYLLKLKKQDRGALATLRHSLAFDPGTYPKAFPYVERFAGVANHERDARRLALYAVAGLFAHHPLHDAQPFAAAFGVLMQRRSTSNEYNKSIENRFIALLGADAENVLDYLRQAVSLLAANGIGFDFAQLLDDLSKWMNPALDHANLRQHWARDFYRVVFPQGVEASNSETATTD